MRARFALMVLVVAGCSKPSLTENTRLSVDYAGSLAELKRSLSLERASSGMPRTPGDEALARMLPKLSRVSYECGGGTLGRSYIDYRVELRDGRSTLGRYLVKCAGAPERLEATFSEDGTANVFTSGEERSVEYSKALSDRTFGDLRQVLGASAGALEGSKESPSAEQIEKSWQ